MGLIRGDPLVYDIPFTIGNSKLRSWKFLLIGNVLLGYFYLQLLIIHGHLLYF